jgi:hypothetical protein
MPTENPKVSAYVPQALKDRLKQFREERNISESQAVTIVLAEYFQMPEVLGRPPEGLKLGDVNLARMEALEQELASFAESVEQRLQELGKSINRLSELRVDQGRQQEVIDGQRITGQANELPVDSGGIQLELHQVKKLDISSPPDKLPKEIEQIAENNEPILALLSELPSDLKEEVKPIPGRKLSELRFGLGKDTIAGVKRKMSPEEFTKWTREKDPDKIAWKYVESPTKGYIPVDELPDELKSGLLAWIKKSIS